MSYTAITDLDKRLSMSKQIQLTDFDNTGFRDEDKITEALNSGAALIDSYAGGRYTLPLVSSQQVKDLELTIAIYELHALRQIAPEKIRQDYEDAIAFLKDVSSGKASLDQATLTQISTFDVQKKDHTTSPDAFDNTRLADFIG